MPTGTNHHSQPTQYMCGTQQGDHAYRHKPPPSTHTIYVCYPTGWSCLQAQTTTVNPHNICVLPNRVVMPTGTNDHSQPTQYMCGTQQGGHAYRHKPPQSTHTIYVCYPTGWSCLQAQTQTTQSTHTIYVCYPTGWSCLQAQTTTVNPHNICVLPNRVLPNRVVMPTGTNHHQYMCGICLQAQTTTVNPHNICVLPNRVDHAYRHKQYMCATTVNPHNICVGPNRVVMPTGTNHHSQPKQYMCATQQGDHAYRHKRPQSTHTIYVWDPTG